MTKRIVLNLLLCKPKSIIISFAYRISHIAHLILHIANTHIHTHIYVYIMQQILSQSSWCIIVLSLLIDMNHARSFPSYNIVIGIFTWYCAQLVKVAEYNSLSSLLNVLSCYTTFALFSILLDVTFCFVWGRDIIDGDVRSVKFAFAIFLLNMVPKGVALL